MKAVVVHDTAGRIVSVTLSQARAGAGVGMEPASGESVAEVDLPEDAADLPLHELIASYHVDIGAGRLERLA